MVRRRAVHLLSVATLALLVEVALPAQTHQATSADPLFATIVALDRQLFEAYNSCDLAAFGALFSEDVEFYHDQGGLTRGRPALVESVKKNICGKTRRDPVPGTLEVHPMKEIGAIQIGVHRFCDVALARCDGSTGGIGKYIHLWRQIDGQWQLTRAYSYDHEPARK